MSSNERWRQIDLAEARGRITQLEDERRSLKLEIEGHEEQIKQLKGQVEQLEEKLAKREPQRKPEDVTVENDGALEYVFAQEIIRREELAKHVNLTDETRHKEWLSYSCKLRQEWLQKVYTWYQNALRERDFAQSDLEEETKLRKEVQRQLEEQRRISRTLVIIRDLINNTVGPEVPLSTISTVLGGVGAMAAYLLSKGA